MRQELRVIIENTFSKKRERLYLLPLNEEKDFIIETYLNGRKMFKVLVDEGICNTEYFYPVSGFRICEVELIED